MKNSKPSPKLLKLIIASLDDAKAEEITTIDLAGKTSIADQMVISSGRSNQHVTSIADQLVEDLKKDGIKDIKVEGQTQADWVLVDAGDVIVHVFRPEVRSFYNLEKLWSADAPGDQAAG